jgi:glycosyltransferase involved in cell wall biosynthesis
MESIWDLTQVLLMPSLWCEAWGLVVVEAQIRGIPVIASDTGAIPEAKRNVPYIVPVNKLTGLRNEGGYVIESQNVDEWVRILTRLMSDRDEYGRVSDLSREVTSSWVTNLGPDEQEKWLLEMMPRYYQSWDSVDKRRLRPLFGQSRRITG